MIVACSKRVQKRYLPAVKVTATRRGSAAACWLILRKLNGFSLFCYLYFMLKLLLCSVFTKSSFTSSIEPINKSLKLYYVNLEKIVFFIIQGRSNCYRQSNTAEGLRSGCQNCWGTHLSSSCQYNSNCL